MTVQVRPPPEAAVYDVRQSFSMGHLQPTIQRSGDGDALGADALGCQCFLQLLQLSSLLQLLHQAFHRLLTPLLLLAILLSLLPAQQSLDNWGSEGQDGGHGSPPIGKDAV